MGPPVTLINYLLVQFAAGRAVAGPDQMACDKLCCGVHRPRGDMVYFSYYTEKRKDAGVFRTISIYKNRDLIITVDYTVRYTFFEAHAAKIFGSFFLVEKTHKNLLQ